MAVGGLRLAGEGLRVVVRVSFLDACGEMVEQVACLVVECLGLKLGDRLTFSD